MDSGTGGLGRTRMVIRVQPRAKRPGVVRCADGGWTVRVVEPAEHGRATEAALRALADALGVRRAALRLVTGARSRTKLVEVESPDGARPGGSSRCG